MPSYNIVKIYSNDGSTLLFTSSETVWVADEETVTETGVTLSNGEIYTYEGNKKFLGIAGQANQTIPEYAVGDTFSYGNPIYIVEEELKGEPPTAEGVKSKLQSLITASNAKTGKSDANLTDAVNTLLEGYGKGETVEEYDGAVEIVDSDN